MNKTVLEIFAEHVNKMPNHAAVLYDTETKITNIELWELSGRIYAWLKSKGIGAEDIVMYHLPRGAKLYACIIGTMRAGAAFVLTETDNDSKRTEYIKHDCNCKLFVDETAWKEISETKPKEGFEPVKLHNLCYIAYTSGTTGNPKGVLHEYGSMENARKSCRYNGKPLFSYKDTFLVMSPMNFVSLPIIAAFSCASGNTVAIAPYSCTDNEEEFIKYIEENNINCGYMTPSFLRRHINLKFKWDICLLSSEPADGLYIPGVNCYNVYASTESGCLLAIYKLTHPVSHPPVGKSQSGIEIFILDDKNNKLKAEEPGEICYKNPYVRGYLNHPELTKQLITNGIFHTGDCGEITVEGELIVKERLDQTFKIRGYRIDSSEIADAVKKVSNLKNIIVKGFVYKDISSIIVFYTDNIKADATQINEKLLKLLPGYMIPTNYIHMEQFPLLETGKTDKRSLLQPGGSLENIENDSDKLTAIAKGRTSDIYAFGNNKILKIYKPSIPFSEINKEKDLIKTVRSLDILTPNVYEIVRTANDCYGIVMDKADGITIENAIKNYSTKQQELICRFADSVKKLHSINVSDTNLPNIKEVSITLAEKTEPSFCSKEDIKKIQAIFESIPDEETFVHGDCHTGNAVLVNNNINYIDLMFCGKGNPVFDLLCMYSHYVFLPSFISDETCINKLGVNKKAAEALYDLFIEKYYLPMSPYKLKEVKEYITGVHSARICIASVALPDVFPDNILREAKRRMIAFYETLKAKKSMPDASGKAEQKLKSFIMR